MGHPHCEQDAYGLPAGARVPPWREQLFWPLFLQKPVRAKQVERSTEAELAPAKAIIVLADGTPVAVGP